MKIEEFVAHSTNVNCLSIGKKACRMFITGGDDHKVNLWAIGKPTSLMSLCGHTSPVESVAFDTSEVLVLAGASMGAIKLWDLEEAKMVRTLTGHRSSCTAVEFHPFDLLPDGRWVVSGGCDNVVKVWDLTAGKLLHDFKFHEGHVRSIDFHPLEFLLATGSADRTVKFWDLETFELIGSTTPEATGVRSITFHPDGRTLFCGLDDSLKVYSWEPVICHDAVDMGWSTLGDLCIQDGKLLGCSFYRNSVGIWVGDISCIEPYGDGFVPEESECTDQKFNILGRNSSDKAGSDVKSTLGFRSPSPDYETKEIKNIYVDSTGGNPVTLQRAGSLNSSKVVLSLDSKETSAPLTEKQSPLMGMHATLSEQAYNKSLSVPTVVPRDIPVEKDSSDSGKETITFTKTKPGMLLRPAHVRRPSNSKNDVDKMSVALESGNFSSVTSEKGSKHLIKETVTNLLKCSKEIAPVKIVNGVAVVSGRTRSLVERFERRDKLSNEEELNTGPQTVPESNRTSTTETNMTPPVISGADRTPVTSNMTPLIVPETDRPATIAPKMNPCFAPETDNTASTAAKMISIAIPERDRTATIATKSSPRVST
ncbi:hypothetical protein OIU76_026142 [Salix suchowensis]|nr:hypothetical protein OIU76_026142 [Salix suchowensis]